MECTFTPLSVLLADPDGQFSVRLPHLQLSKDRGSKLRCRRGMRRRGFCSGSFHWLLGATKSTLSRDVGLSIRTTSKAGREPFLVRSDNGQ